MASVRIIGSVQVKNEDIYVERSIRNILNFCDEILITDNLSTDNTYEICQKLASRYPKIRLVSIQHPRDAALILEPYYGTNSWIFGVDGDEIYDPHGLCIMRERIMNGDFDGDWCIFGNVLNVVSLSLERKTARGYLAPPSRSMTKLYNFQMIEDWRDCPERFLGGEIKFKNGYHAGLRRQLHVEVSWEQSYFRCLHMAFMKRSTRQKLRFAKTRLNPDEINYINAQPNRALKMIRTLQLWVGQLTGRDWKSQKYRRGLQVKKDVTPFFPLNGFMAN